MIPAAYGRKEKQVDSIDSTASEPLHVVHGKRADFESGEAVRSPAAAEFGIRRGKSSGQTELQDQVEARSPISRLAKRTLDIAGAVVLAAIFSPLILAVSFTIRRSGAAIIYRHRRIGLNGQFFDCLKFRTMVPDADRVLHSLLEHDDRLKAEWIQDHKLRHDPRVTRLGRFLRRTSLDELPQLWNVVRGDMSLVGPRPVVREELLRYGRAAPLYLSVKPGVTGLWQAMGRNDTDYRRRVAMDVYYVRNQSLIFDCYILLRTAGVVLAGNGAY